jgi:hypothetical protein
MRTRLLATALLLPLLVACGAKDGSGSKNGPVVEQQAVDVLRAAAAKTAEGGTARFAMSMEGSGMTMQGTGVTSLSGIKSSMKMSMAVGGQTIDMEAIMLDTVMYMKMPMLQPDGKWMKLDLAELSKAGNVDLEALSQMQQNDPKQALAYLEGVSEDVKKEGTESVRGVETTKYSGTLDMSKAASAQKEKRVRDAIESVVKQMGTSKIPMTVWIDKDGRLRKMVQTVDLSKASGEGMEGLSGTLTTTFEMYDFGVKLDVKAPPENEVTDGSALLGGAGG